MFVMVGVRFLKPKIGTLNHDNRIVLTVGGASRNGTAVTPGMSPIDRPPRPDSPQSPNSRGANQPG